MRVLHIMSGYGGGISSFIRNKAIALKDKQIVFDVVTYDECSDIFIESIHATGGDVYLLNNPKKQGWSAFKQSFESVLKANDYDVIHSHIRGYRAVPYYLIGKKYANRFYIHAHDSRGLYDSGLKHQLMMWGSQRINRFISDSYLGCGLLANQVTYGKVPKNQQMIIPNSIDIVQFIMQEDDFIVQKQQLRQKYAIQQETIVVGHIARLKPVKNQDQTLAIAQAAKEQNMRIKFMIVGAGELEDALHQQVEMLELSDYVTILGRVEPIQSIMPLFDVLILPSLYEGLPTVAVEAQAIGIPIVMSDTITQEVDFDLHMTSYVSLEASDIVWLENLIDLAQQEVASAYERVQALERYYFTNDASAQLYLQFLRGEIKSHLVK